LAGTKKAKKASNAKDKILDEPLVLDPGRYEQPRLVFEDGALVLKAVRKEEKEAQGLPDYFVWHAGHWVAPAYRYVELKQWLVENGKNITNNIPRYFHQTTGGFRFERRDGLASKVSEPTKESGNFQYSLPLVEEPRRVAETTSPYYYQANPLSEEPSMSPTKNQPPVIQNLRPYQIEAIESWKTLGGRGTIVLPTGAGKSIVATLAIDEVRAPTLIVVPQLDLLHQWYENLSRTYGQDNVGVYFGEKKDIRPITVTTYVSASSHLDELGNRFYLLICDEVHHLTSATWQHAARLSIAPKRLALTATYPPDFEDHLLLQELIGPPCYYKAPADLAGTYLAEYETVRVRVEFTPDEQAEYDKLRAVYGPFVQKLWQTYGFRWYDQAMRGQNKDPEYRQALVYKARMEEIIEMARAKRLALARILALHRGQSAIIFTETNRAVYELAEMFMLPAITHQTSAVERKAILDGFRSGEFPAVVTARVLNEGVDLPSAKVAIIVGGGGSSTEYIQRLGRILRRQGGAKAFLYEIIVRDSLEERVSNRRRLSKKNREPGAKPG
jgi:superfamily II DNA or RNA helicase